MLIFVFFSFDGEVYKFRLFLKIRIKFFFNELNIGSLSF